MPISPESPQPGDQNDNTHSEESTHASPSPEVEMPIKPEDPQLPPEALGETNGGPLGCCLGAIIGLLLSISIPLLSRFFADPLVRLLGGALSTVIHILMVLVAIVAVLICSYFGWRIGKNVYRE